MTTHTAKTPFRVNETFRLWVKDCLALLNLSAASVSNDLGLGRNYLGQVLADPARDIRMGVAHRIACHLREKGIQAGTPVPPITCPMVP